jgi:class 3 adenylate cyclase
MPGRDERRAFAGLLFTDVVGSTEIASEIGYHRWRVLLERHLAVLRDQLRRFEGQEIDTAGDGVFAVFDAPGRAIRCAAAIASAAREDGLELRSGIHNGEIERSGNRARGIAVHVAARAISYAGAGEIVVTQTVRDVVAGSPLLFETAGVHELKGVPGQWHLFRWSRSTGSLTSQRERHILERAVRAVAEQAAKADDFVDEAIDVGHGRSDPLTHAKMLRLELLKVKAELERELETFSMNCSACGLDVHWVGGLGITPGHWAHREPAPHGEAVVSNA